MKRLILFALLFVPLAAMSRSPFAEKTIIENDGTLCFDTDSSPGRLTGNFRPTGCFSSSCTDVNDKTISLSIDDATNLISVATRFELQETGDQVCTRDCAGAGEITFDEGVFEPGSYAVKIGERDVGSVDLSAVGSSICVSTNQRN